MATGHEARGTAPLEGFRHSQSSTRLKTPEVRRAAEADARALAALHSFKLERPPVPADAASDVPWGVQTALTWLPVAYERRSEVVARGASGEEDVEMQYCVTCGPLCPVCPEIEEACEHGYVREYPSAPRDNWRYIEVCRHCGEAR